MNMTGRLTKRSAFALGLHVLALAGCDGADGEERPPPIDEIREVDVETSAAHVRVTTPYAGVFRVRLSQDPEFPELPSFAVAPGALAGGVAFTVESSDSEVVVHSGDAALRITKDPTGLALLNGEGEVVAEEAAPIAWDEQGATISWTLDDGEHVYGLGDKTGGLDRRGHKYKMWNTDHYQWTVAGPQSDPLYKSIPNLVFVEEGGGSHGLFIDNPGRAEADVGATNPAVFSYAAERASTMDLYLVAGPDPKEVIGAFSALTGLPPLPPRWSLGYHQCRYSYTNEAEAREVAARLRADNIPVDAIWLDIHFQEHFAPFTVDPEAFPNFTGMLADFSAMGLNTVLITDPHIRKQPGDWQYDDGLAGDHFVRNLDGSLLTGGVWPSLAPAPFDIPSVFPEFTLASAREWWGSLFETFVTYGVAGIWNDMNEPSVPAAFDPDYPTGTFHDETPHRLDDGTTVDHVSIHNAYGLLNTRATYEGLLALRPDTRPFVLTRAAYAGSQRWGATWTGDNTASRDHLAITIPQLINMGVSGFAYAGADVGGYSGCPYFETKTGVDSSLLVEWMELGALQPFLRNHSEFGTCRREPWLLGPAVEARLRKAIERRYRLLPYIYTLFEETSRTGLPVMRPLWLEYPTDATTYTNEKAFLLGRDLLIAPKLAAGSDPYTVRLPAAAWWDTTTGELIRSGGDVTVTPPADDSIRIFARAGAIVPSQPLVQTAGNAPQGALSLDIWPGEDCRGSMYLDDGQSFAYRRGSKTRVSFTCTASAAGIRVTARADGHFPGWWTSTRLLIHGASAPSSVTGADGARPLPWSYDGQSNTLTVTLDGSGAGWTVESVWGEGFTVSPTTDVTVDVGDAVRLASSAPATWASNNAAICTARNGVVTGVGVGTCQVTATSTVDGRKKATVPVEVVPYVFEVTKVPPDLESIHVRDEVLFASTRRALWKTGDSAICTADDSGVVTGKGAGTCVVIAQSPIQPTSFQFELEVTPRPASHIADEHGIPRNVYVKGDFPNFPRQWDGFYENMMRLSADYTWQWTWTFDQASAGDRIFKFVGARSIWPLHQMFNPKPGVPPGPNGLTGPLKDEASILADGQASSNIAITVEPGTYLFTFYEAATANDEPRYTIERQP
jgi:alpha-glucosidase